MHKVRVKSSYPIRLGQTARFIAEEVQDLADGTKHAEYFQGLPDRPREVDDKELSGVSFAEGLPAEPFGEIERSVVEKWEIEDAKRMKGRFFEKPIRGRGGE